MDKEIIVGIGALIGAGVSLIQVAMKFLGERRNDVMALRSLGAAKQQIEVLENWYDVKTQVTDPGTHEELRAAVNAKLDEVMIATEQSQTRDPETRAISNLNLWLLLFFPRSTIAWLGRVALIFWLSISVALASTPTEGFSRTQDVLFGLFCFGILGIPLYAASIWDGVRYNRLRIIQGLEEGDYIVAEAIAE